MYPFPPHKKCVILLSWCQVWGGVVTHLCNKDKRDVRPSIAKVAEAETTNLLCSTMLVIP